MHTDTAQTVTEAIEAGASGVEHGVTFPSADASMIEKIKLGGITYTPTLAVIKAVDRVMGYEFIASAAANALAVFEAGVPIALGTDSRNTWFGLEIGESVALEAGEMAAAGIPPAEVIKAATMGGGSMLVDAKGARYSDFAGSIEAGKTANIIGVRGNPLDDVSNLGNVRLVILNGKIVVDRMEEAFCSGVEPGNGGESEPCSSSDQCDGRMYCNPTRCVCYPPRECVEAGDCVAPGNEWSHEDCPGSHSCENGLCEWTCG